MRVGVYVDGLDMYYGARDMCGPDTPGWGWVDIRSLARSLVGGRIGWDGAHIGPVVYCTAAPPGEADQETYRKALLATGSVDHIEYGHRGPGGRRVPLAAHMLADVRAGTVGAVVVIANDGGLRSTLREARLRVPVGTVNPSPGAIASGMRDRSAEGVIWHWWRRITGPHYRQNQLSDPAAGYDRPAGW